MLLPEWLATLPYSTIFILVLSGFMSFLTSLINSRLTSKEQREQLNAWRREVSAWTSDLRKAKRAGDKKLIQKLMRKEKRIKQLQMKVASQSFRQMRSIPIFMVLFVLVWLPLTGRILLPFLSSMQLLKAPFSWETEVAYLPWFDGPLPLTLFWWYMICSFAFGVLFSRVFGLGMGETK